MEVKTVSSEWFDTNMDIWYEYIKETTMKTEFVAMERATLEDMNNYMTCLDENHSSEIPSSIKQVIAEVDKHVQHFGSAFVKLSCRSPKDVTITSENMKKIYLSHVEKLENPSENTKAVLLYQSHIEALKVTSAREAFDLFFQSQRILQDVSMSLESKSPIQVIIREWVSIPIANEFRGFVYNGSLNGLSQYFDLLYFDRLNDETHRSEVVKKVKTLFEDVSMKIPFKNYIIDFGIDDKDRLYIIELNPWTTNADACLFRWSRDLEQLQNGPFEFRFNKFESKKMKNVVFHQWHQFFDKQ